LAWKQTVWQPWSWHKVGSRGHWSSFTHRIFFSESKHNRECSHPPFSVGKCIRFRSCSRFKIICTFVKVFRNTTVSVFDNSFQLF
jgi:hypothetical protein